MPAHSQVLSIFFQSSSRQVATLWRTSFTPAWERNPYVTDHRVGLHFEKLDAVDNHEFRIDVARGGLSRRSVWFLSKNY